MADQTLCNTKLLTDVLQSELQERQGIEFIVVATSDGFLTAEAGVAQQGSNRDANRIATMAVSFSGLSHSLAGECEFNDVQGASIVGKNGMMLTRLIYTASVDYVLLICFNESVNSGIASWTLDKTYEKVRQCLA